MDDKCRKCWIPVHLLSHSVCNIQVSVSWAQCKALETGSPRRQWSCLGALPAGRRGCSHELPWMLMEPCRGLGGKPQEEFPAEIPGRQAGAGREQTQGRGNQSLQPASKRPCCKWGTLWQDSGVLRRAPEVPCVQVAVQLAKNPPHPGGHMCGTASRHGALGGTQPRVWP